MSELDCARFRAFSAEVALGVAEADDRAVLLAHVERCPGCRRELSSMTEVADRVAVLASLAEPPPGFETRVLARLGGDPAPSRPTAGSRTRGCRLALRVAVAAAVVASVGVGGWAVGHDRGGNTTSSDAVGVRTSAFISGGHRIGEVVTSAGRHPWVAIAIETALGDERLTCQVVGRDGQVDTVGTYRLVGGYGYWGAPVDLPASGIAQVRLIGPSGRRVATASL